MSLENKIELLTAAIDRLNANLALVLTTPVNQTLTVADVASASVEVLKVADQVVSTADVNAAPLLTHNELQSVILSKVRANMDHKSTVKAILSGFGAAKVTDLKDSDLEAVLEKVNAL